MVTSAGRGLTSVLARAMGQVAAAQIGVIDTQPGVQTALPKGNNFIDDLVFAKLREMNVSPSPLSSDQEFVRRVYLDCYSDDCRNPKRHWGWSRIRARTNGCGS